MEALIERNNGDDKAFQIERLVSLIARNYPVEESDIALFQSLKDHEISAQHVISCLLESEKNRLTQLEAKNKKVLQNQNKNYDKFLSNVYAGSPTIHSSVTPYSGAANQSQVSLNKLAKLIKKSRSRIIELETFLNLTDDLEKKLYAAFEKTNCRKRMLQERKRQEEALLQAQLKQEKDRQRLICEIREYLARDFLAAELFYEQSCANLVSLTEFETEQINFVQSWTEAQRIEKPDTEQAAAIAAIHKHVQVIARAGSGKTATLVNRAYFLQRHCRVPPDQMLLVAFNRKAAEEIAERLGNLLKGQIPHVMTFHALAYAIVHPEESLLYNGPPSENQSLNRAFQEVIDEHLQLPEFKKQVRELMLTHFREDWERIVAGGYDKNKKEFLQFRRSLPHESLRGEYVKSFGEKIIADFFFENDIPYRYEKNHWWNNINYRPDFTVFKEAGSGVIVEYFGLAGDPDYDAMSQSKREYWSSKPRWSFLEFSPDDITREGVEKFKEKLEVSLEVQGISCKRLSEDEIWDRVRQRAIDRFTKACSGFIGRCRKRWLTPEELASLIEYHVPISRVESLFLPIALRVYIAYLTRLQATGEEDFDGLMQRAAERVAKGHTVFERKSGQGDLRKLRYIFIDEYQDLSELFHRLVQAIYTQNPDVNLFCVGDDWQAINGFAGSDLRFFNMFADYLKPSQKRYISTNYRSSVSVVELGNVLMNGFGKPAVAHKKTRGKVWLVDLSEFEPSPLEVQRHQSDKITPAVLRLASKALTTGYDVVLLCRHNRLPWFVNYQTQTTPVSMNGLDDFLDLVRSYFPKRLRERITVSTAHGYKLGRLRRRLLNAVV